MLDSAMITHVKHTQLYNPAHNMLQLKTLLYQVHNNILESKQARELNPLLDNAKQMLNIGMALI